MLHVPARVERSGPRLVVAARQAQLQAPLGGAAGAQPDVAAAGHGAPEAAAAVKEPAARVLRPDAPRDRDLHLGHLAATAPIGGRPEQLVRSPAPEARLVARVARVRRTRVRARR